VSIALPFAECPQNPARFRDVELHRETAHVMQNEETARLQRRIPKIQFVQGRLIFVRAVEKD